MPTVPGIYFYLNDKSEIIYIGKAKNLRKRVSSYFLNKDLGEKTTNLVSQIVRIKTIVTDSEIESLLLEANYIRKYKPKYNFRLTDDKRYPSIQITVKDKYPKVLVSRMQDDSKSLYFGAFPNASDVRLVLKIMRRIFPFQAVRNHSNRTCLYYHLGLCLCPTVIEEQGLQKLYKNNIKHLLQFLNGKSKNVIKDLEKERDRESRLEHFEIAADLQKKINALEAISHRSHQPFDYEVNPNLRIDLRRAELKALQEILNKHNVPVANLQRIECYDISNISGTNAVGSMVVLTKGEIDKSQYRKFKIRFTQTDKPNDFAMMKEVLTRRLKHGEWQTPDLIVVDGGKGQISSAMEALSEQNINIPLVGLAKREETIITSDFAEILLSRDNPALQLVMRIRNEAHRFAITYHRKLRAKKFLSSQV